MCPYSSAPDNRGSPKKIVCLEAEDLRESEYNRGTGCGNTARPGLCGGCRVTGIPTAELNKRGKMRKAAAISTVITAIILLITLGYQFYFNEYGPAIGDNDNYDLHVTDRMAIINNIGSLVLKPEILIRNDGTLPVRITKVMALLQVGDHFEVFIAGFIANILPHNVWY